MKIGFEAAPLLSDLWMFPIFLVTVLYFCIKKKNSFKNTEAEEFYSLRINIWVSRSFFVIWKCQSLSCVWLFANPWTVVHQAPLSMRFSRIEYWSGLPFPSPGDLPNPGIEPGSPTLQVGSLPSERMFPLTKWYLERLLPSSHLCHQLSLWQDSLSESVSLSSQWENWTSSVPS